MILQGMLSSVHPELSKSPGPIGVYEWNGDHRADGFLSSRAFKRFFPRLLRPHVTLFPEIRSLMNRFLNRFTNESIQESIL